jgi:precorrin isomerase
MSEMVLRLPSIYVDVESDEMEYVDGGVKASIQWYGVKVLFTERETQTILKVLNAGAGVAAVGSALAAMGVVTAIGTAPTALVSAALWASGGVIDLIDHLGGNDGVALRVLWNGVSNVWSN